MAYAEYGSPLPAPALNSEHPLEALFTLRRGRTLRPKGVSQSLGRGVFARGCAFCVRYQKWGQKIGTLGTNLQRLRTSYMWRRSVYVNQCIDQCDSIAIRVLKVKCILYSSRYERIRSRFQAKSSVFNLNSFTLCNYLHEYSTIFRYISSVGVAILPTLDSIHIFFRGVQHLQNHRFVMVIEG